MVIKKTESGSVHFVHIVEPQLVVVHGKKVYYINLFTQQIITDAKHLIQFENYILKNYFYFFRGI